MSAADVFLVVSVVCRKPEKPVSQPLLQFVEPLAAGLRCLSSDNSHSSSPEMNVMLMALFYCVVASNSIQYAAFVLSRSVCNIF